jgi:hypothetical protein
MPLSGCGQHWKRPQLWWAIGKGRPCLYAIAATRIQSILLFHKINVA